jgi:beta-galactosidase
MYFGADYYPEHWPQERWETDAQLMQQAGINIVRMGEFAWSLFEPKEGRYCWDWLDKALEILGAHGISAVLGTPTATPPAWMCQAYPEIMACERNGHRVTFGERRQYCPTNTTYRGLSERIATVMAEHYASHPQVVAWQIDNEFAGHHPRCYCPDCQRAFQNWLHVRYDTLDALTNAWGTHFWSHDYSSWSQIPLPVDSNGVSNPCLELDFYRFSSDQWVAYQQVQLVALRKVVPAHQKITHNFMGFGFQEINYYNLARELDFVAWDNYPIHQADDPSLIALSHATMRGLKDMPFWVMEEQSGPSGWQVMSRQPRPGQIRLWAYQAIAHGADAMVFFRWRTCQFNTEEYWHGILEHHGQPRRRYFEVQQMGQEIARIGDIWAGAMPPKVVAILMSYDDIHALRLQPGAQGLSYNEIIGDYYRALHQLGVSVDIIPPDADLAPYRVVIAPILHLVTPTYADNLKRYVNNGGVLWIGARSGVKDESSRIVNMPLPGLLADLCGVEVEEYDAIGRQNSAHIRFTDSVTTIAEREIEGHTWCDILTPAAKTKVLARYSSDYYAGKPAFTRSHYGKGMVFYMGVVPGRQACKALMAWLVKEVGIQPLLDLPEGVEATLRTKGAEPFLFVLNHTSTEQRVALPKVMFDLVNDVPCNRELCLPGYGVAILVER